MVAAVLADAARFRVDLPDGLAEWFQAGSAVLDEVTTPVLVHFDLWQGNIFVDPAESRVVGIIDPERAFWGDPLADFVSLALLDDIEKDRDFLAGCRTVSQKSDGRAEFTDSARRRLALYRSYLHLIMLTETVPRDMGDEHDRRLRDTVAPELIAALVELTR
jgi:aminoglycoside phosphotransferase (APT) family kinase protein